MLGYVGFGKVVKEKERRNGQLNTSKDKIKKIRNSVLTVLFYGAVVYIIKGSYNPFIYFNF